MIERHYVTPLSGIKVKYRGNFDLGRFYKFLKLTLEGNGFLKDEKDLEKEYVEKIIQGGKQLEFRWEASKTENDYVNYQVRINARILLLESGTDLDMKFIGWVETGGESFDKLGAFTRIYHSMIEQKRIPYYQTQLYKKIYKFQEEAKKFLGSMNYA